MAQAAAVEYVLSGYTQHALPISTGAEVLELLADCAYEAHIDSTGIGLLQSSGVTEDTGVVDHSRQTADTTSVSFNGAAATTLTAVLGGLEGLERAGRRSVTGCRSRSNAIRHFFEHPLCATIADKHGRAKLAMLL
jgi:hypothetical protein